MTKTKTRVLKMTPEASKLLLRRTGHWQEEKLHKEIATFLNGGTSTSLEAMWFRPLFSGCSYQDIALIALRFIPEGSDEELLLIRTYGDLTFEESGFVPAYVHRFSESQLIG